MQRGRETSFGSEQMSVQEGAGEHRPRHSGKSRATRMGPDPTQEFRVLALGVSLEKPPQTMLLLARQGFR